MVNINARLRHIFNKKKCHTHRKHLIYLDFWSGCLRIPWKSQLFPMVVEILMLRHQNFGKSFLIQWRKWCSSNNQVLIHHACGALVRNVGLFARMCSYANPYFMWHKISTQVLNVITLKNHFHKIIYETWRWVVFPFWNLMPICLFMTICTYKIKA